MDEPIKYRVWSKTLSVGEKTLRTIAFEMPVRKRRVGEPTIQRDGNYVTVSCVYVDPEDQEPE